MTAWKEFLTISVAGNGTRAQGVEDPRFSEAIDPLINGLKSTKIHR
jgi:hypothetical protein